MKYIVTYQAVGEIQAIRFDSTPEHVRTDAISHILDAESVVDDSGIEGPVLVSQITDTQEIDIEELKQEAEYQRRRYVQNREEWQATYEALRDELGHWRTLAARKACPQSTVALCEDRIKAHLAILR